MKKIGGWLALGGAAALAIVGLTVGTAAAQARDDARAEENGDDEGFGSGHGHMARIREALDLTDAQVEQARELREAFRTEAEDLRSQIRTQLEQIPALLRDPDLSQQDLLAVHDQVHDLAGQLGEKRIEKIFAFLQTLTAEQRAKLGDLLEERAGELGRRFGFGFGGGDGAGPRGRHGRAGR